MEHASGSSLGIIFPVFLIVLFSFLYVGAAYVPNRHKRLRQWPLRRCIFWILGVFCTIFAVSGPLAERAHTDFNCHMTAHLLLGMLAPLLIALSAPMTLLLRTVKISFARRLTRLMKIKIVHLFFHPVVAAVLNIGGLWLLYMTNLYYVMHENMIWYVVIHMHIFIAGYLFTVSMIYMDLVSCRYPFAYRAIVLVLASGGHGILSKYIYAYPPAGVGEAQAKTGGMLMYYGGDAIDLIMIFIFCLQWFRGARPKAFASVRQGDSFI
ncbi:cytochrome c oxidase assembly protein [Peribacillus sp. B-H-3]|uniref:cytochrome c oxidase assembly protein n=1 Tax=Peribacillus sp. B-H-3 TaxID=3400420 RepID=UPI003B022D4C